MKYRLETIPNIGTVNVTREGSTNEMGSIDDLDVGKIYFVRTSLGNSEGYGHRILSWPSSVRTGHRAPGPPPQVTLEESSSTSITISWGKPLNNGGKEVSKYELWMGNWSGGSSFMVYDVQLVIVVFIESLF